jgi:hypothetical protein
VCLAVRHDTRQGIVLQNHSPHFTLFSMGDKPGLQGPTPSMRRPVSVKRVLSFPSSGLNWSPSASAAILPCALFC